MRPSVELFKLIKSLTKSEKRFFKLMSVLQSGDKNYIKIFDFIDAQEEYDEELLKKEFKDETFIKHLSSEKNHLYKLILKSLRSYYSEASQKDVLKLEIKNIEILYNKALYKECYKIIHKAKKIAKETESFYYWNEVIYWEKKILEEKLSEGNLDEKFYSLIKEEEEVIKKLRNLAEYQIIYSRINNIFRSGGFTRSVIEEKQVEKIANYHLIKGKNTAISVRASSMCYYIKGLCAATNRNYSDSYQFFSKTKEILDNHPIIKQDLATRYVQTITYLLRCYIDEEKFVEATNLLNNLKKLKGQKGFDTIDMEVKILSNTYLMGLLLFQRQGEFEKSIQLIDEIDLFIHNYYEMLNKEQLVLFTYYKSVSFFAVADYRKALLNSNKVLNDNEQNLRKDIYSFARVFNLVLHLELENYDFAEYAAKSVNRYLSKLGRDFPTENLLIKRIKKLSKSVTLEEQHLLFVNLEKDLTELFQDHHEQVILEYFNILAWTKSKVNKTKFSDEVIGLLKCNNNKKR